MTSCAPERLSKDRSALREHCTNVSGNDTPAISLCAPDASISERAGKGHTLERPAHLHAHTHHRDVSKELDPFLAWLETRDAHQTAAMGIQVILLAVHRSVWPDEDKRVVHKPIELSHIAGQLRSAKVCLARAQRAFGRLKLRFYRRHLSDDSLPQWRKMMKIQRLLLVLTAVNLGLLGYQVFQPRLAGAATVDVPDVLRGRALEIVDARGKIRASIAVLPENPKVMWKGKPYPETVLLRLISPEGRPNVKLGASHTGAGLLIGGESNPTYIQVLAEGGETTLKLINKDSTERLIKP